MPREQITYSPLVPTDNPNVFNESHRRNVHISWNATGWIQLGIDVTLAELRGMVSATEAQAADARKVTPSLSAEGFPFRVQSDVLDRTEANKLIRTARNARDKAYGRDE